VKFTFFDIIIVYLFKLWLEGALLPATDVPEGVEAAVGDLKLDTVISFVGGVEFLKLFHQL